MKIRISRDFLITISENGDHVQVAPPSAHVLLQGQTQEEEEEEESEINNTALNSNISINIVKQRENDLPEKFKFAANWFTAMLASGGGDCKHSGGKQERERPTTQLHWQQQQQAGSTGTLCIQFWPSLVDIRRWWWWRHRDTSASLLQCSIYVAVLKTTTTTVVVVVGDNNNCLANYRQGQYHCFCYHHRLRRHTHNAGH